MTVKYPRLLDTDPVGEDQFTGGAQQRIADTIRENLDDPKFKIIGLEGPWGSGKSNVVKILEKNLGNNFHFFIYDAWAHQEDLQRRSFLESLTESLAKDDCEDLRKQKLDKLSLHLAKIKHTRSVEIPKINWVVILVIAVAALLPIAGILVEDMKLIEYNTESQMKVALSPLILFVIVYVIGCIKTRDWQIQKIFAFYKKSDTDKTVEEIINEYEPNAGVFRAWIRRVSEELVKANKRLIIVLDNMDRLPKAKVLAYWSHLHTFFSHSAYDNINIIVPYDRKHIQLVYGFEKEGKKNGGDVEGDADYYISKTFPLVFVVPTTVITDWKEFFARKFKEAFGPEYSGDAEDVRIIFNCYYKDFTPREMISYLNAIVGLCLVWKKQIPIRYLALYTATRRLFYEQNLRYLLDGKYAESANGIFNGDDELLGYMAQLLYNIPKEHAQEVILYKETKNAIQDDKPDELLKLSANGNFVTILGQILEDGISLSKFIPALDALEKATQSDERKIFQPIWRRIIRKRSFSEKHANEFTDVDRILLLKGHENRLMGLVGKHVCELLASIQGQQARSYAKAMVGFESFVVENKLPFDVPAHAVPRLLYGTEYIDFVSEAKDKWNSYKVTTSAIDLDGRLTELVPRGLEKIPVGPYLKNYQLPHLEGQIKEVIQGGAEIQLANLKQLYKLYREISPKGAKLSSPQQVTLERLLSHSETGNEETAILTLMVIQNVKDLGSAVYQRLLDINDPEFVQELYKWYDSFLTINHLIRLTVDSHWDSVKALFIKVIQQNEISSESLNFFEIIPKCPQLVKKTGVNPKDLLVYLDLWADQCKEQLGEARDLPPAIADVIHFFIAHPSTTSEIVIKKYFAQLLILDKSDWVNYLQMPRSEIRPGLDALLKYYPESKLPEAFSDGFCEALIELSDEWSNHVFEAEEELYTRLMSRIDKSKLKTTLRKILEQFLIDEEVSSEKFLFFEKTFREFDIYDHSNSNAIDPLILQNIYDERLQDRIFTGYEYYLGVLKLAPEVSLKLINKLRELVEGDSFHGDKNMLNKFLRSLSLQTLENVEIIKASYSSGTAKADTVTLLKQLQEMAKSGDIYHFQVSNKYFKLDEEDFFSILNLEYRYGSQEGSASLHIGEWLRLPARLS